MNRIGSLCTGYGGLDMAARSVFGGELAWWSDIEPGPIKVMEHHHPEAPNIGDLKTADWTGNGFHRRVAVAGAAQVEICGQCGWANHDPETCQQATEMGVPARLPHEEALIAAELVNDQDRRIGKKKAKPPFRYDVAPVTPIDILTAGYPCQPFSNAGKRLGTEDPRHLWPYIADAISLLRPRFVVLENVSAHLRRGFDVVLQDLAAIGYDAAWSVVRASDVGAPHRRERLYVVATDATRKHDDRSRTPGPGGRPEHSDGRVSLADADSGQRDGREQDPERVAVERASFAWSGREAIPDAQGVGRGEGRPESTGFERRPDVAFGGLSAVDWQQYEPAIRRWERVLGVPAPAPSTLGPRGGVKVSPAFAEWLMGVPGRITSVPGLSINGQLKLAGNGVVPQQAEFAIRGLLERIGK